MRLPFSRILFPIIAIAAAAMAATPSRSCAAEPGAAAIEAAFSPGRGAERLVIKVIDSARSTLRIAAYSFTSKPIAQALLQAKKRGVDVQVVVDKSQLGERYTSATFLANAGIPVRVDREHAIQHNKFIVADGATVETGSLNYTKSGAERNAENVLVVWRNPPLAALYESEWRRHWDHALPYPARY